MIASFPILMLFITNCGTRTGKPDLTIDRFKKCLDNCEERSNRAYDEYQTCRDQAYNTYVRRRDNCGNRITVRECLDKAFNDYLEEVNRCELEWKENLAKVSKCRRSCYKEEMKQ